MSRQDDGKTIREGAAIGAVAPRAQIVLTGSDRASYLQGLLTNDIQALVPGSGCYSAWLTPQGRMLTDLHVLAAADMLLLDVPVEVLDATLQRLDQFLFGEDVQIGSAAGVLQGVWVHGPRAAAVLEQVVGLQGLAAWDAYHHERTQVGDTAAVVARIDQLDVPGFCVYIEPSHAAALNDALVAAGAVVVSDAAILAARIEAGYPVFGVDMTEETIPLEAGIEQRAISFSKGCYVGQEIVIRVLHRGGGRVAKRLVALRVDGAVPAAGARLTAGEKVVGAVTSAAESSRAGTIALGYVHRDFTEPGTVITVETSAGPAAATVSARPIPSVA